MIINQMKVTKNKMTMKKDEQNSLIELGVDYTLCNVEDDKTKYFIVKSALSDSIEDNIKLLEGLQEFKKFRRPILVGLSDKRMTQGNTDEFEKKAINLGASILRTHRMPCFEL